MGLQAFPDEPMLSPNFDWNQIFIGREQELEFFQIYVQRWLGQTTKSMVQLNTPPSPNDKIPSLVVLLYGRGGFGKTTLLRRYRELALKYRQEIQVSKVVDWEFAAQNHRALFNLAPGEKIDTLEYYALLHTQLAFALSRPLEDFKEYALAIREVNEATKLARGVLSGLQRDDHYSWLRGVAGESILTLLRFIPSAQSILSNEQVAGAIRYASGVGLQIGIEQIRQVWGTLHDKLGAKMNIYLEQPFHVGQGLGRDLAQFSKKNVILLFFDTYEEIDEGDDLLRLVTGIAGSRVGWVLSGRDNLWAGRSQRLRSQEMLYGYKDIVFPHLGLAVDFSADGVGDFSLSAIQEYFTRLHGAVSRQPPLPPLSEKDAAHILEMTKGVPLAVRIAASLYLEHPDLTFITQGEDSKREIVDQMVRRYLLHTRTNPEDRAKLYGLALLRRAEEPAAVTAALRLPESRSYDAELSRLQRRYGFVFARQEQPSLHQEVRYFMRLWLLEHATEPEIVEITQRLKESHQTTLQAYETQRHYTSVRTRLEDEEWVACYLDLVEQHFWLDPPQGVAYILPFMVAAALYQREVNREAFTIGAFFEPVISQPYRRQWKAAANSLRYQTSFNPLPDELTGLKDLIKLAGDGGITFPSPLPDTHDELEAALWCRLGEAYKGKEENESLYWHTKGITQLMQTTGINGSDAENLLDIGVEGKELHETLPPMPQYQAVSMSMKTPTRFVPSDQPSQTGRFSRRSLIIGSGSLVLVAFSGLTWLTRSQWYSAFSRGSFQIRTPSVGILSSSTPSHPTATPLAPHLEQNFHEFIVTLADPAAFLNNDPTAISSFKEQVRSQRFLQGRFAGTVIAYGGAPSDSDISEAATISHKAYEVLRELAQEGFAFQGAAYYQSLFILGAPLNRVTIDVYLFAQ